MPSARTILEATRKAVTHAKGAGLAGVEVQAELASQTTALTELVDAELDPRLPSRPAHGGYPTPQEAPHA